MKAIWPALVQLFRQVWFLPRYVLNATRERQRQLVLDELEAERLDRIRNPSKYLGK